MTPALQEHDEGGLVAFDTRAKRVTRFDSEGAVLDTWAYDSC